MSWVSVWAWPPGILLLFTFLLLLFPDGRLPSPRWRPVAWLSGFALVLMVVPVAIAGWPIRGPLLTNIGDSAPAAAPPSFKLAYNTQVAGVLLMFILGLTAAASLVLRLRRATGDHRQQLKWFAFAGVVVVVVVILASPLAGIPEEFQILALPLIPLASAIAILKYRLYDIDVVIKKAVILGLLAAFITAVYAAAVIGVGAIVGQGGDVVLSAIAAAIVAVAFQPVRLRARHLANRLVYGKRATPYEVLSEFSERAAGTYSTEDVLPRMAQFLATGTGATEASVWLRVGSEMRLAASWPPNGLLAAVPIKGDDVPGFRQGEHAFPVRHGGELLGAITLTTPPSDPLSPEQEKLLNDAAAQTGLVVRNVRLIEELRESRRRIVTAQDERAKALERNIHDGAQQQLVALAVKQRLAENLIDRDPDKARLMMAEIRADTTQALENLRDLARGIYPPLLADRGLPAALEAQIRKASVPVELEAKSIGRYPPEIEAAVYFSCLEALQNVSKYANATHVVVRLAAHESLTFEVSDDGLGFDPRSTGYGTGLQGMVDRLEAVGGALEVRSAPGEGTTVTGRVPLRD
jgi:signal transduction histidine kinase